MHCRCGSRWVGRSAGRARRARSYRTEARHDPASARPESRSGRRHTAVALSRDRGHRPRTGNLGGWCSRDHSRRAGHASSRPEIPPDSVGGFIYTGGPLQLADLADHGVCYAGHGAEWQGWLCAKETGRYELEVDGSTFSPNNYTSSTCVFAGWLEDRAIGVQEANPRSNVAQPAVFSLIPARSYSQASTGCGSGRHAHLHSRCAINGSRSRCWKRLPPISTCARSPETIWRTNRMTVVLGVRRDDMTLPSDDLADLPGGEKVFGARGGLSTPMHARHRRLVGRRIRPHASPPSPARPRRTRRVWRIGEMVRAPRELDDIFRRAGGT